MNTISSTHKLMLKLLSKGIIVLFMSGCSNDLSRAEAEKLILENWAGWTLQNIVATEYGKVGQPITTFNVATSNTSLGTANPTDNSASAQNNITDFATSVFNSIKSNDFNSFIALLPSAPFTLKLSSLGRRKKEDIAITAEAFTQLRTNYQIQFNSIISALHAEGLTLNDIELDKIIAEFDRDENFQVIEIYLVLNTIKGRYRIRIEDCFGIGDKFLPEQLKWHGQNEYRR